MSIRPKYTAVGEFSCAGDHYVDGDPVDNPIVLDAVLPFGDRFVKTDTKRATKSDTNPPSAAVESPKEQ